MEWREVGGWRLTPTTVSNGKLWLELEYDPDDRDDRDELRDFGRANDGYGCLIA